MLIILFSFHFNLHPQAYKLFLFCIHLQIKNKGIHGGAQ
jgi:hypothetical protein